MFEEEKDISLLYSEISVGDVVNFGRYEQDGDTSNGAEPVEWITLD